MKEMKNGIFTYNNEDYEFSFKTSLSAYEKQIFVKTVVDNIVSDDRYDVVVRDLIFDFVIVELFTNVDTSFINIESEDGDYISQIIPIEHFLEESNVADVVKENMEHGLLEELNRAIDLNVQYLTGIKSNSLEDAITSLISTLEKKIKEIDLDSAMEMVQKFAGMTEDFNLDNLVNAYMSSNIHKDNLVEIEDSKK